MSYCARFRFKILSALQIPDGESLTLTIPRLPPATLEMGQDAFPFGKWAILKMTGFATENEARQAGEWLGNTLLIVGAITKLGIDVGFSRSTLQFSADLHTAMNAQSGRVLRAETHGLMVYEEDTVSIVGVNAQGSVLLGPDALQERLTACGDILEVRIVDVRPRPSANPKYAGKPFGSNAAANWGFQYKDLITEPKPREVVTIYELDPGHISA